MAILTLFSADLDDPSLSQPAVAACLNLGERSRAIQFARPELTRRFVAGRVVMRHVLGRMLGNRPADVSITYNAWGKPIVVGGPFFNLSHAGPNALFAVDEDAAVGVDVECNDPAAQLEWFDIALSSRERLSLDPERIDPAALLRLWVRKEAVAKAVGRGLSLTPGSLDLGWRAVDTQTWYDIEICVDGLSETLALIDHSCRDIVALARVGAPPSRIVREPFSPVLDASSLAR